MFAPQAGPSIVGGQCHQSILPAQASPCVQQWTRLKHPHVLKDVAARRHRPSGQSRKGSTCAAQHSRPGLSSEVPARQRHVDAHGAPFIEQLAPDEVDRRLRKAAALMATAHRMAPFDKSAFNAALLIWCGCCFGLLHGLHPLSCGIITSHRMEKGF